MANLHTLSHTHRRRDALQPVLLVSLGRFLQIGFSVMRRCIAGANASAPLMFGGTRLQSGIPQLEANDENRRQEKEAAAAAAGSSKGYFCVFVSERVRVRA